MCLLLPSFFSPSSPSSLLLVRALESSDKRRYKNACNLTNSVFNNTSAYAREEVGINTHQNHLASLTHVKSGLIRRWLLSTSLWLVNLLARLWFNRGDFGGIPTILSARWVMIDEAGAYCFSTTTAELGKVISTNSSI